MNYNRREQFKSREVMRDDLMDMFRGNNDITVGVYDFDIRVAYDEKVIRELKNLRGFFMKRGKYWKVPLNEFIGVVRLAPRISLVNEGKTLSNSNDIEF